MNEIVFFVSIPLTRRDYKRLGIDLLTSRGFKVQVLDMTSVFNPNYNAEYPPLEETKIVHMNDFQEIRTWLSDYRKAIGIDTMGLNVKNRYFYRLLKQLNFQYLQAGLANKPWPALSFRLLNLASIRKKLKKTYLLGYLLEMANNTFSDHTHFYQPPRYVLRGGRIDIPRRPLPMKTSQTIWAHAYDYDLFLETKDLKAYREPSGIRLAVFLDEYFPFHPDYRTNSGTILQIDGTDYYKMLNRIFDRIEKDLNCQVVIAAHPRSRYDKHLPSFFGHRRIELNKTNELVSLAFVVLAHASTSTNFAVLHKKPIIFLTCDTIDCSWYGPHIAAMADELGKLPLDMNQQNLNFKAELSIDEDKFQQYRENYIKLDGTPEKQLWDIVADRLLEEAACLTKGPCV